MRSMRLIDSTQVAVMSAYLSSLIRRPGFLRPWLGGHASWQLAAVGTCVLQNCKATGRALPELRLGRNPVVAHRGIGCQQDIIPAQDKSVSSKHSPFDAVHSAFQNDNSKRSGQPPPVDSLCVAVN